MMRYIQISILVVVVAVLTSSEEYKFGFNNSYTCHCWLDEPCDNVTGSCIWYCSDGWSGPSCQQENVAYESEHVKQSGVLLNGNGPENAVDGWHTKYLGFSVFANWWFIDLQRPFSIGYLKTFTFKHNETSDFKGFSVHIDNELCFKHNGESDPPDEYLIECDNIITGRYVNISVDRPDGAIRFVNLREVEIYVCSRGTYGLFCNNFCHCSNYDKCNVQTGQCPNGCQIGWFGDNCNSSTRCEERFYGEYCNLSCNINCNGDTCDDNVNCLGGCINGYHGKMCDNRCPESCRESKCNINGTCIECMKGYYGDVCSKSCSGCINDDCDYSNGECILDGCKEGYWGEDGKCNKHCPINCLHVECNSTDGVCTEGCLVGYQSFNCTSRCNERCRNGCSQFEGICNSCDEGQYGETCDESCSSNCLRGCDQTTGICNQCKVGYYGDNCTLTCSEGCTGGECNQDGVCKCNSVYYGTQCIDRCSSNCLNDECYSSESGPTCTAGCIDGYKGSYCQDTCLDNCITCNRYNNKCTSCEIGWYGDQCQTKCNNNCANECDQSAGRCQSCKAGWYGDQCQTKCNINCDNECDQSTGRCQSCKAGWYGGQCHIKCSSNCANECDQSTGRCDSCKAGWYDDQCQTKCNDNCANECDQSTGHCQSCKAGWYGDQCQTKCNSNCVNECDQSTGLCQGCMTGWYGGQCQTKCNDNCTNECDQSSGRCQSCKAGWYGDQCQIKCNDNCFNECDQSTGRCDSCKAGWYDDQCQTKCNDNCANECDQSTGHCQSCKAGWYGDQCQTKCNSNCANECDQSTGRCDSCKAGWYDDQCQTKCNDNCANECDQSTGHCQSCKAGWYGDQCQTKCNSNCANECDQSTGLCQGCMTGWYGDQCQTKCNDNCTNECDQSSGRCQSCKAGWYGDQCQTKCNSNCANECDQSTGRCDSCKAGWYDDQCQTKCNDNCANECDQSTGLCQGCMTGWYGGQCQTKCNDNCANECDQSAGHCQSCKARWYGDQCQTKCNSNCANECDQSTGRCESCKAGWYDDQCQTKCNDNCANECDQSTGHCQSCKDGWYGDQCQTRCNDNCVNECDQSSGSCQSCKPGWYGDQCQTKCYRNCVNECDQSTGHCQSCKAGWYGDQCQIKCNSNCANECHQSAGRCQSCKEGWYGDQCQTKCDSNCANECDQSTGSCQSCKAGWYGDHCQSKCNDNCDNECDQPTGRCESCKAGWYDDQCQTKCNDNCANECDQSTGHCQSCKAGWYDDQCQTKCNDNCANECDQSTGHCESCKTGWYGDQCQTKCYRNCVNECDQSTGHCQSCKTGWYGDQCQTKCNDNCANECDQSIGSCQSCKTGWYGDQCQTKCNDNCANECDQSIGSCQSCKAGWYGDHCQSKCNDNCDNECDQSTGRCVDCKVGKYGITCGVDCSTGCLSNGTDIYCNRNGHCRYGCIEDRYGSQCNERCPANCTKCHPATGACSECNIPWYGKSCNHRCIECFDGICAMNGTCVNGCINDKYGTHCQNNCSYLCKPPNNGTRICEQTTGMCIEGCRDGFQGENCAEAIPIVKKLLISFNVTNRVWDNGMTNDQSKEYKQMKQEIEENFMIDLSNVGIDGIDIINMRPGSVDGVIFVNENGTIQNTSQIFLDQVNTGKMGNLTVKDGMIYQEDQYISSATLTLRGGDPDKLLEGTVIEYACKFRLVSINGVIKPNVRWFLDDTSLTHTSRIKMRNSTESEDKFGYQYIIQFDKAISSHSGLLKCLVESSTNSAINSSATERVKIIPKPVVTLWPLSTFLQGGESVTLKCSSSSSPVNYTWFDAKTDSEIELAGNEDVYNLTAVDKDIQVYCTAGNLAGTTQSLTVTIYYVSATDDSVTCTNSTDARNTTWPSVKAGSSVKLSCGEEYSHGGYAQRQCSESGDWSQPDYSNCKRSKLVGLKRGTDDVKDGKLVTTPERTLENLANLTTDGKQFSAGDVEISVQILRDVVDISKDDSTVEIGEPELKNFAKSASNILEADDEEWKTLAEQGKSGIAVMMDTVDAMAKLCSSRLEDKKPITASTDKMVIEIGKFDESSSEIEFPRPSPEDYPAWMKTSSNKVLLRRDTLVNSNADIKDISYNAVFYNDISKIVEGRILVPGESMDSKSNETVAEINSKILAVSVYPTLKKLDPPIELSFQHLSDEYPSTSCVFMDLKPPYNKRGRWSTEGCKTESTSSPNVTICKCDHLTNFAILMSPAITPIKHREALSIISAFGCAISLFCLLLTVGVYLYTWRYVKSDKAIILMNLCVTLIIAYIIFLGGVTRTDSKAMCQTVAVLLHFFFLVVFFLMLAEGVQVLISVVALAMTSRLKWILTASWGIPVVIVVISVAVTQLEGYGNEDYCWLSFGSGLLWAFIGPALAVILVNLMIVIKVLTVMFSTTTMVTKSTKEKGRTGLKALCVLLPIIGLTWVFGVFSVNGYTVIFQYLFAIFNSLQGLFIFIFHCYLNRQVKEAIKIKRRRYRAKSIDTGTKSLTQSNQTRSTCDNEKVTSFIDDKALPVSEADCQANLI